MNAEGAKTFTVVSSDAAGNASAPTTRSILVDTVGPTTTLVSSAGAQINAAELADGAKLTGKTEAGARISLTLGDGNVRSVLADGDGDGLTPWSKPMCRRWTGRSQTLSASATDLDGNTGTAATTTVAIDANRCTDGICLGRWQ
jgi:hypothetical protein